MPKTAEKTPPTVLFIRGLPQGLRDRWKAFCAMRGKSMKKRLIELMRSDISTESK